MTTKGARLNDLARIATLLSDRALAPVAAAQARVEAKRTEVAGLATHRRALDTDGADPVQAAFLAQQARRLRRRQASALSELARLEAELEIAKAAARAAYGRKLVLDRLHREA
jgi:hypothetical protein